MRGLLLGLMVLAVFLPGLAAADELLPLQQSDDDMNTFWGPTNRGAAEWFEAPAAGHVVKASFYVRHDGTKNIGVWSNLPGSPDLPGKFYGSASASFTGNTWHWSPYSDVTDIGATVENGEKFWVGIMPSEGVTPLFGVDLTDPDVGYAVFDGGWSWVANGDLMVRVILDDDMDPPYIDEQDPADGELVPPDAIITFRCKDVDNGLDVSTVDFAVEDGDGVEVSGVLDIDDADPNDVMCTFTPYDDLPKGTITCTVAGTLADGLGNEMGADEVWSFTVGYANVENSSLGEIKATYR